MVTLTHPRLDRDVSSASGASARAVLERAVAAATTNIPAPRAWLRRVASRDRSAAALIRRYRLWPAIEHAYERVRGEFGNVLVSFRTEELIGSHDLVMSLRTVTPTTPARSLEVQLMIWDETAALVGKRWPHLSIYVNSPVFDARVC